MDDQYFSLEEQLFDDGLTDIERKASLLRSQREADDIEADLSNQGPLRKYVDARRNIALGALQSLVVAKPDDIVAIATAQAEIREYLRCCEWITSVCNQAVMAEQTINEEFGTEHGESEDERAADDRGQQKQARKRRPGGRRRPARRG